MKRILLTLLVAALGAVSCATDDSTNNNTNPPVNIGESRMFAIDTAKILSIADGGSETIVLNHLYDLNSYIAGMAFSPDGTKIIYIEHQREGTFEAPVYKRQLRIANADGTGDTALYTTPDNNTHIGAIRFCSDSKIFFSTYVYAPFSRSYHLINPDGSGLATDTGSYEPADVTDARDYFLVASSDPDNPTVDIIHRAGDNGAGSLYHHEDFPSGFQVRGGEFTNDGKYAVVAFREAGTISIRVIEIATKTHADIPILTGLSDGWTISHVSMAADNKTGVVTIGGGDFPKSKTYGFNIDTQAVQAPFENNDENIFSVYVH